MKKLNKIFIANFGIILLTFSFAFAHERQVINIGGTDYLFTVGSLNETVVVGDKTGLDLRVATADEKDFSTSTSKSVLPISGLEKTLKVQNISDTGETKDFDLSAAWGKPGNYETLFYPTSSNKFTYRIYGQINGQDVDLKFTCNPAGHVMGAMDMGSSTMKNGNFDIKYMAGTFGCPKEKDDLYFPSQKNFNLQDNFKSDLFGVIALALVLAFIVQKRNK